MDAGIMNIHKISSSDSTSFSLGFKRPISMGGTLLSLERTALEGEQNVILLKMKNELLLVLMSLQ